MSLAATVAQEISRTARHRRTINMNRHQRRANARLRRTLADPRAAEISQVGNADALHSLGLNALKAGQHDAAVGLFRRALQQNGQNAEYLCNLGTALSYQGRFDEAIIAYRQAIGIRPSLTQPGLTQLGLAQAHSNLGNALREQGRFDEAVVALRESIRIEPNSAEAQGNLGAVLCEQGKLEEAIAALRQTIRIKPHLAEGYSNLGIALRNAGKLDEAVAAFHQAIRIRPDLAEAHSNLGTALREQDKPSDAVAACCHAIRIRPNFADAYANLGAALRDLGRLDEAIAAFRQAIVLKPNSPAAHNNLAVTLTELGRLSEGRAASDEAVRLAPRNARYRRNRSEIVRCATGDPDLMELELLARDGEFLSVGDRIELHFALAKTYDDLGRHADAFRQWGDGNALKRQQITYDEPAILGAMDRARSVFTPELMKRRQNVGHSSSVPIFVVGMLRSGTTLVEQILASHPQVFGAGELMHFRELVPGMRTISGPGGAIFPEAASDLTDSDLHDLGARYLSRIERLSYAPHISDKMPSNFMFAGLIHLALPNARIIHAIRDPLDTCLSCFSRLFAGEQNHTYDLGELGRYYRGYRDLMAHWHRVLPPDCILDVRYEDVVADLEGQARRILAHCGLDWDPRCLAFHQTERPVRTASATQVRQPIYNSSIGRWRLYEPFLGPLLAELVGNSL
jgi:tetratricopeptide (TPR) repeat protein